MGGRGVRGGRADHHQPVPGRSAELFQRDPAPGERGEGGGGEPEQQRLLLGREYPVEIPEVAEVRHEDRRVEAGLREDVPDHVCDCRLPGAAADGDRVPLGDELCQHLRAAEHLDAHRPRCIQLGRRLDGAAVDEEVLEQNVLRVVAELDPDAGVLELSRRVGRLRIAPAALVSARRKDQRDRRDAGHADAHQMDLHPCPTTSLRTPSTR